jgi:glycosyltransferase involved in cell wall biosynthesis
MADGRRLNILHVLRAPVGGLFRHVLDLSRGQIARGHRVGLVADAGTGGREAEDRLAALVGDLALGLSRVAMSRQLGRVDLAACAHVSARARQSDAHVVHGHGAKGGAYARLARVGGALRVYTPHGGSLHYGWGSPAGVLYLAAERALRHRTDLLLFESAYGRDTFCARVGRLPAASCVVHNGVTAAELAPVVAEPSGGDLVFVGELRRLKGVDVLIEAIARLAHEGLPVSASIVGEGPDRAAFEAQALALGLTGAIRFLGAKPARAAFALGRLLVVPSRAESLPYIVLEAAAAGVPMLATRVGGIPEIYGPDAPDLVPPDDVSALARSLAAALRDPLARGALADRLRRRVRACFSAEAMTEAVLAAYSDARSARARAERIGMRHHEPESGLDRRHGAGRPANASRKG